ncbi:MAG: hypothetical protein WA421_09590 [Nitrososphaeraceae archaeon]
MRIGSKTVKEYKERVPGDESISKWQSLSFGAQYKSAYCMAVCPAGEDLIDIYKKRRNDVNPFSFGWYSIGM